MIKAVIFDMDGVLINTEKYLVKYWCQAAEELGMPMKREHALMIRSFSGKFAEPWLKGIYGETFDYVAVRERRKEIMAEHLAKNGWRSSGSQRDFELFKGKRIQTRSGNCDGSRTGRSISG